MSKIPKDSSGNYIETEGRATDSATGFIQEKAIYIFDIKDTAITHFGKDESIDEIYHRNTLIPLSAAIPITYKVTERNQDDFLMDTLKFLDKGELDSRLIRINFKLRHMPKKIYFYGENINLSNDPAFIHQAPHLGNNVRMFPGSSISFRGATHRPDEQILTRIGDNVVVGTGVHIPAYNMVIEEGAVIANFNGYNSPGFKMRQGAYISSGLNIDHQKRQFTRVHNFYSIGPENEIGRYSSVKGDVILTGYSKIPAYSKITGNVPLIFANLNLESIYLRATGQVDGTIYATPPNKDE